ncbi:hypothetical protein E0485_15700 [Paenibacillus albiflavus]|uniref:Uncharacterized protein n=1 Tax=Paenibacillus albiflavus TaxID=2545760 RepID=A0A4R4ECX8_9BACL|nr:hypothetical protein [Paenibacillus albiflavus]TCZ75818.1 hypothetical protein E0485_15700 [Paenibacillus albiflavus]
MRRVYLIWLITALYMFGLIIISNIHKSSNIMIPKEEAESIAMEQALNEGYKEVRLWTRFNAETTSMYAYSEEEKTDIKVWKVRIEAKDNPPIANNPAVLYYIKAKDGSVLAAFRSLTQAGIVIKIGDTQLNYNEADKKLVYESKFINSGDKDYLIEWIQPFLNQHILSRIEESKLKMNINKTLPHNSELLINGEFETEELESKSIEDLIIGYLIKMKEDDVPFSVYDERYWNGTDLQSYR